MPYGCEVGIDFDPDSARPRHYPSSKMAERDHGHGVSVVSGSIAYRPVGALKGCNPYPALAILILLLHSGSAQHLPLKRATTDSCDSH